MWNVVKGCLEVGAAVIGLTDDDESLPLHTSQDDGFLNTKYVDGQTEFHRDFSGEIRDSFGNTPD